MTCSLKSLWQLYRSHWKVVKSIERAVWPSTAHTQSSHSFLCSLCASPTSFFSCSFFRARSVWPRSRFGAITLRTRALRAFTSVGIYPSAAISNHELKKQSQGKRIKGEISTLISIPGNPPSRFRSQRRVSCVLTSSFKAGVTAACQMVTVKTPPVLGIRATSPKSVPNVDRSSWANYTALVGNRERRPGSSYTK